MGRTLKRVSLNFNYPLNKVWEGYLNPHYKECPECEHGYTVAGRWLDAFARLLLLVGTESISSKQLHPYLYNPEMVLPLKVSSELTSLAQGLTDGALLYHDHYRAGDVREAMQKIIQVAGLDPITWGKLDGEETSAYAWLKYLVEVLLLASKVGYLSHRTTLSHIPTEGLPRTSDYGWLPIRPSQDMVKLSSGLAEREPDLFIGHDSIDSWSTAKNLVKAAGCDPDTWGICPTCKGEGVDPAMKEAYEAWEETEPPTGEGYQLWETTTEGSPQSPVFASLDELCTWCESNATTFGSYTATAEEWKRMLDDGFVSHQEGNIVFM